jgi:hypothetical protein
MARIYWSIFWRTFSVAAAALLGSAEIYKALQDDFSIGADLLLAGLIMAGLAGLIAAGHAYVASPAVTPLGKAIRQAFQVALATLATVVITVPTDVLNLGPVLVPGAIATVLAFFVTLFANQGALPVVISDVPVVSDAVQGTTTLP